MRKAGIANAKSGASPVIQRVSSEMLAYQAFLVRLTVAGLMVLVGPCASARPTRGLLAAGAVTTFVCA